MALSPALRGSRALCVLASEFLRTLHHIYIRHGCRLQKMHVQAPDQHLLQGSIQRYTRSDRLHGKHRKK